MKRRDFLKSSMALATAATTGVTAGTAIAADGIIPEKTVVRRYGVLGKTGLAMSDISIGTD